MESILKSELESQLLTQCGALLEPMGFRPVDLDCHISGRSVVRIYIERLKTPAGSEPVETQSPGTSLQDCTQVSHALGPILEADPKIPTGFDLEVSSPGLDRRLRLQSDFEAAVGNTVKLKLVEKIEGKGANITGTLNAVGPQGLTVLVGKDEVLVPLRQIKQAVRVWDFGKQN